MVSIADPPPHPPDAQRWWDAEHNQRLAQCMQWPPWNDTAIIQTSRSAVVEFRSCVGEMEDEQI